MENLKVRTRDNDEISIDTLLFSDNQPHITVNGLDGITSVFIKSSILSSVDLMNLLQLKDVLDRNKIAVEVLDIMYMLGARMDRPIDKSQPFTLKIICDMIRLAFPTEKISVMDPHSDVTLALLDAEKLLPVSAVYEILDNQVDDYTAVIAPDAGATRRVEEIMSKMPIKIPIIQGLKHRNMQTGALSGFSIGENLSPLDHHHLLIIDDICDGGGTFSGLAEYIHTYQNAGAKIDLFVTHGIFSKNLPLPGIDQIFTTDTIPLKAEHEGKVEVINVYNIYNYWEGK